MSRLNKNVEILVVIVIKIVHILDVFLILISLFIVALNTDFSDFLSPLVIITLITALVFLICLNNNLNTITLLNLDYTHSHFLICINTEQMDSVTVLCQDVIEFHLNVEVLIQMNDFYFLLVVFHIKYGITNFEYAITVNSIVNTKTALIVNLFLIDFYHMLCPFSLFYSNSIPTLYYRLNLLNCSF